MKFVIRFIPFFIVLGAMSAFLALPVMGQTPEDLGVYYLPIIAQDKPFQDTFTIRGLATSPSTLRLERLEGETITPIATVFQDNQQYAFTSIPLLRQNQQYRVSYYLGEDGNTFTFNRLAIWHSRLITQSVPNSTVWMGFGDLDGFSPKFPSDMRRVALPFLFEWNLDYDQENAMIKFYNSNGDVVHQVYDLTDKVYLMDKLPLGMEFNEAYDWELTAESTNGEVFIDVKRTVVFTDTSLLNAPQLFPEECSVIFGSIPRYDCYFEWESLGEGVEYNFQYGFHTPQTYEGYPVDIKQNILRSPLEGGWGSESPYRITLSSDTTFQWRVKARNEVTEGVWSGWRFFTTPCPSNPHCP